MLTVAKAAERLDVSPDVIYAAIAAKRLRASNVSVGRRPTYRIEESALAEFLDATSTRPIGLRAPKTKRRRQRVAASAASAPRVKTYADYCRVRGIEQ